MTDQETEKRCTWCGCLVDERDRVIRVDAARVRHWFHVTCLPEHVAEQYEWVDRVRKGPGK